MNKRTKRIALGAVLFVVGILVPEEPHMLKLGIFLLAYAVVGYKVIWKAVRGIINGQMLDENFLMAIASLGAFFVGEYHEAVAVMLFYQVGEAFEEYAVGKSRRSIAQLMNIRPDKANLKTEEGIIEVRPSKVKVGDIVIVKPGEKVPLDGIIFDGSSALDTAALTGESLPREVTEGDEILSGCINMSGLLEVKVTKRFGESTVNKILDLVENAANKKAKTENFITRFAVVYTPVVVACAVALAAIPPLLISGASWSDWIYRALNFLVVSCPCALVISVPLSFFGGIGGASKAGVLVKG
ncbi:MAG: HAD-IC family P-type ATPase, partial [Firmicutes bacterium]|nr:HAD-IC family P-type ATPase [Bacillota bacterium]